jgi:histidinol-phosphatase
VTSHPLVDELALALLIADRADAITMDRFNARDLVVETKPDLTPVSDADKAVEQMIRDLVAAERPDQGVLGEFPSSGRAGALDRRSADGTKNFVRRVPVGPP